MPIYEFQCTICGKTLEISASIEEKQKGIKLECPECKSKKFRQVYNSFCITNSNSSKSESSGNSSPSCGCNGCCG